MQDSEDDLTGRLTVEVHYRPNASELAGEVREGLTKTPKSIPPKYFYDARGSALFDEICATPEYYPTRAEHDLLESVADTVIAEVCPTDVVELGSGTARKTRAVLDAIERARTVARYVPFDVSETTLRESTVELLRDYRWLRVHGIVGDYHRHLHRIPDSQRRLFLFIGSTIGNFTAGEATTFLESIAEQMDGGDHLLLGTDLVKDHEVLHAAYNDAGGITAEFNENILEVINRELDADFDVNRFQHQAYFDSDRSQIEMHLKSTAQQSVVVKELDMTVEFEEGETILTEISRKFTRDHVETMLADAGLDMTHWFAAADDLFGLSLSRPTNGGGRPSGSLERPPSAA